MTGAGIRLRDTLSGEVRPLEPLEPGHVRVYSCGPTVYGRIAEFKKMTALLTGEFKKAGITDVVVKDHDNTQTIIARWKAAGLAMK